MSLRRLSYFVAVGEELSFTAAARRLRMAQPPLSTQIRELERELGVELVNRERRRIALTAAGHALLPEARRLLARYEAIGRIVRRASVGESGRLAVGLVPSAANGALPNVLMRFGDRFPAVDLTLVEDRPPQLLARLASDELDVVLQYGRPDGTGHESVTVSVEELMVAVPVGHPLAGRKRVPVALLAGEPLILPARHTGDGLYDRITRLLAEHDVAPTIVHGEVWLMQTIAGLVSAGLGIAVVPASTALVRHGEVVYLPLGRRRQTVALTAVWRAGDAPPTVPAFVGMWRDTIT